MVEELKIKIYKNNKTEIKYCGVCYGVVINKNGNTPYIDGAVYCDC